MKGTRHNGRSGKNGVYNPLHNDRRFNPEHSEHIDNERVRRNIYWDCYQGYTTMEDQGKENNFSFEQIELAFYEEHYGNYVMKQNERHVKARHPDRCKEVEDVWKNKKTCPEESIYQLGTIDKHASAETLVKIFEELKKEFENRFGSNVHIIDWALHMDEANAQSGDPVADEQIISYFYPYDYPTFRTIYIIGSKFFDKKSMMLFRPRITTINVKCCTGRSMSQYMTNFL